MKKIITLLAALLLPFLATANTLDIDMELSQELQEEVTTLTQNATEEDTNPVNEEIYMQALRILTENAKIYSDIGVAGTPGGAGSHSIVFYKSENLQGMLNTLNPDKYTEYAIVSIIVNSTVINKFDTLLSIGVDPIVAGLRTGGSRIYRKHPRYGTYVKDALEKGQMTYEHFSFDPFKSEFKTISVQTNEEEVLAVINDLKESREKIRTWERSARKKRIENFFSNLSSVLPTPEEWASGIPGIGEK